MIKLATPALLLLLAGCISFSPKPPPSLLTLRSTAEPGVGTSERTAGAPTIQITSPSVPQEIATLRVPVRSSATTVAYLKDAQWVEPVNRQFQRLLSDTLTARTNRVVVSDRQFGVEVGASLGGELRAFGVDAATGEAVVTYDATLIRGAGAPLEKRRFEARLAVPLVEVGPVGVALNEAANRVAGDVAEWVGR
jgi:cholesterol transport system auxiliary component